MAKRLRTVALFLTLPAVWIAGEIRYASRIRPGDVRTVAQHFTVLGCPQAVYLVRHASGEICYELEGFPGGGPPLLAAPSSAPAYIYDGDGTFLDWCVDPGDSPLYRRKWPRVVGEPINIDAFHAKFNR